MRDIHGYHAYVIVYQFAALFLIIGEHLLIALGHSPFDGSIDVADNVSMVLGDVVLNVVIAKCFVVHHLLNYKTTWIEIAIETAVGGGELQDAVVGVCHAAWVVLRISIPPNHLFALGIGQHLHRAPQHHSLETFGIAEIDAGLGVGLVVGHTYRKCVGRKVEGFDTLTLAWLQHSLGPRKTFLIY